jgi:predicted RNA-binding Zn-ribbon protein involved in translation (DUF1610 family)
MTGIHTPDFFAVTAEERARGYSARCRTCALPLVSSIEFIGFPCPGDAPRPRAGMDVTCPRCAYAGPATRVWVETTDHVWTVAVRCPECRLGWGVE